MRRVVALGLARRSTRLRTQDPLAPPLPRRATLPYSEFTGRWACCNSVAAPAPRRQQEAAPSDCRTSQLKFLGLLPTPAFRAAFCASHTRAHRAASAPLPLASPYATSAQRISSTTLAAAVA